MSARRDNPGRPPRFPLDAPVMAAVLDAGRVTWRYGRVVGRTFESSPRYDVRLRDGGLVNNLSAERVRPFEAPALAVDNAGAAP